MKLLCSEEKIVEINPEEVWTILLSDRKDEYIVLDVRTPKEYEEGHIPGALFITLNELDYRFFELSEEKKIIVYCRSGRRSLGGSILLCNKGFQNIYNMKGGITDWPYEIVKGAPDEALGLFKEIKEIKELLIFAVKMEKNSSKFYLNAMQKVNDTEIKDLMENLSNFENEHLEIIYNELKKVWLETPSIEEIDDLEFMEGGISLSRNLLIFEEESITSSADALEIALEKECKSFDLYQTMAYNIGSSLKDVFHSLALQERTHIDKLSQLL
ncbi:MAG: rhodanese-like domain-containing protein [Spirochaetota bacterium]|nr:rhodanese-like domain-containing protein [Spirochaetota bacterium]